jgi:glutaredoxin
MLTLNQMQNIADTEYVIFFKSDCPFCIAAEKLMNALVDSKIIDKYSKYVLDQDFDNPTLTELVVNNGWQNTMNANYPSKPQIFMKGEYIGGNAEFYKSKWNIAENMPNLTNPMRF